MKFKHQQIAILDFGSQYTHLIARRFRELKVLARIYPSDYDVQTIDGLIGVVLSGGPGTAGDARYAHDEHIFDISVPMLGLCFGHQLLARQYGGKVEVSSDREYGKASLNVATCDLFKGLKAEETVWMSHGDCVTQVPQGFQVLGTTSDRSIAAMGDEQRRRYGLQFHPEVTHTESGLAILRNFAFDICGAQGDWDSANQLEEVLREIQSAAGTKKVFMLVSGGVDSSVAFSLLQKALGRERVYGLYVDTGLMRQGETEEIVESFKYAGFDNLHVRNAEGDFLAKLAGVFAPEKKRTIIGDTFLTIKDEVSREKNLNSDEWLLGQGTIYPDTIETGGTKHADTIKTHHNRVPAIQKMIDEGKVIEPIKDFYKDEVRALGRQLGLPEHLISRHPFPGPGLAIRVLCSDGKSDIPVGGIEKLSHELNQIVRQFIRPQDGIEAGNHYVLPVKSVGVQGDNRTFAHPAVLVGVDLAQTNWQEIDTLSARITNSHRDVNRVLLELDSPRLQGLSTYTAVLLAATVTKERLEVVRKVDALVQQVIRQAGLYEKIWQFPVVLVPYVFKKRESIVLRPVASLEAMTAKFYPLPQEVIKTIVQRVQALGIISHVFLDVTNKPPGTIEWE